MSANIELTEEQILYFRARRGHLAGPGAPDPTAAARSIVGAQSQQLPPSLLALSQRTKGRPTAAALGRQLLESPRTLVRTWGQRETLHLYDPAEDWSMVVAARGQWAPGGRRGPMPADAALDKALAAIRKAPAPVTRSDLLSIAPPGYVRSIAEIAAAARLDPVRLAAGRLLWCLALRGEVCVADKSGAEQAYAARVDWFPKLTWPDPPAAARRAAADLARRYLASYGPATAKDVAHFFGARVTEARAWLAELEPELVTVHCGDRRGLVALADDLAQLKCKPPAAAAQWPLRLLPLYDSMLMGHADKSWTVPDEAERKMIWRKAAYVAAVAIDRGRVVATWLQSAKRRRLIVEVQPLSRWSRRAHVAQVRREAEAVAAHLELEGADVSVG